ncbi:class I SAM-dependent methyltransferase [Candidatus Woesearchaeota archaeon]|nr:class I SAM-dependent methyltransferase [Candidatus Woesearchaeota archaeon]
MKAYREWGEQKLLIDEIEPTHYVRNFLVYSTIKKISQNNKINNICEIGCGVGNLSKKLGENGFKVDAFDLDRNAIQLAKQYNQTKNVNFFSKDVLKLETRKKYDLVMAIEVIEHIQDDIGAIRNAGRILNKNGFLLITVPINEKYRTNFDNRSGHVRRYYVEDLTGKLRQQGFNIVKTKYFNFPFLWLWYFYAYLPFSDKSSRNAGKEKKLPFYVLFLRIFNKLFLIDLLFNSKRATNVMILAQNG